MVPPTLTSKPRSLSRPGRRNTCLSRLRGHRRTGHGGRVRGLARDSALDARGHVRVVGVGAPRHGAAGGVGGVGHHQARGVAAEVVGTPVEEGS